MFLLVRESTHLIWRKAYQVIFISNCRNVDLEEQIRRLVDSTKKQDEQIAHMKRKNEELEKL